MAFEMFPEVFDKYNWSTMPILELRRMKDAIYPIVPLDHVIIHGIIWGSAIWMILFFIIWLLLRME